MGTVSPTRVRPLGISLLSIMVFFSPWPWFWDKWCLEYVKDWDIFEGSILCGTVSGYWRGRCGGQM